MTHIPPFFRAAARDIFRRLGLEVRRCGYFARSMEMVLEHVRALGFVPATVIDIGVGEGTPQMYKVFPDVRLFMVEAPRI